MDEYDAYLNLNRGIIINRAKFLKNYLEESRVSAKVVKSNNQLFVKFTNFGKTPVEVLKVVTESGAEHHWNSNEKIYPKVVFENINEQFSEFFGRGPATFLPSTRKLKVPFNGLQNARVFYRNSVTGVIKEAELLQ